MSVIIYQVQVFSFTFITSPFKKLKELAIEAEFYGNNTKPLCDVLFGPSSLNQLTLRLHHFTENSFDLLETNTSLTTIHISSDYTLQVPLQPLSRILQHNETVEKLHWKTRAETEVSSEQVQTLKVALSSNTTLKELTLEIVTTFESHDLFSLIRDTRLSLEVIHRTIYLSDPESDFA